MILKRFVFVFTLFLWAGTTYAQDETLHIFGDFKAQPKNWVDRNGEAQGIFIEMLKEVTKRTGIEFSYTFGPWKRALIGSQSGQGGIISFSKTSEREKEWDYTVPFYYDELIFVSTVEKEFTFEGLEKLNGKRIAIKRGATYGNDFDQAIENGYFQIVETSDRAGQMQMLNRGRVDAVLISPGKISLETVISENEWLTDRRDEFVVIYPAYKLDPNHLGIPKSMNKSHLIEPINKAVTEMFEDGTQQKIVDMVTENLITELRSKEK